MRLVTTWMHLRHLPFEEVHAGGYCKALNGIVRRKFNQENILAT